MKPSDEIYTITKRIKQRGLVLCINLDVTINWCEERDEYWYFGFTPLEPHVHGSWGCAKLWKDKEPNFGVLKVVGTGRQQLRPRFVPVTRAMGPSFSTPGS